MRLLVTELRRFGARRAVRWLVVVALAAIALGVVIVAVNSKVKTQTQGFTLECTGDPPQECVRRPAGRQVIDDRFDLEQDLGDAIGAVGIAMLLFAMILGTTFIGGDYAGGALAGQLTFEPRRTRVYLTKAVAVAIGTAVVTVLVLSVLSGALAGVANWRGVVGELDASWFTHRLADMGRVTGVCALTAAIGVAVTTVARRSVASIVGFLALGFIVEPALTNALDLFDGRTPMFALIGTAVNNFDGGPEGVTSLTKAITVASIWGVVLLLLGAIVFARREVR